MVRLTSPASTFWSAGQGGLAAPAQGRSRPEKEAKDREDARRVFVDQAAHETLSATLTPSTAAGSADGDRCTGSPVAIAAATSDSAAPWHR
jgi:hypothetical protein